MATDRYPPADRRGTVASPAAGYPEAVSEPQRVPIDDHAALEGARRAARYAARMAEDLATFADRAPAVLDAARRAEYAALLARDEEARYQRQAAFAALEMTVPSLAEGVDIP